jgi:hypothetical protein
MDFRLMMKADNLLKQEKADSCPVPISSLNGLLIPQRNQRIHLGRASRRYPAGQQRNQRQTY